MSLNPMPLNPMPAPVGEINIPWARLGLFALVSISLALAVGGSLTNVSAVDASGRVTAERNLVFEDRDDGAVVVTAAGDHRMVEVFQGVNGFLRGTLRGFARVRRSDHVGPAAPFRLARWSDGRLTLDDLATGRHVELLAFGPSNAGVFARLLTMGVGPS